MNKSGKLEYFYLKKKKKYVITRMRLNDVSLNNPLE